MISLLREHVLQTGIDRTTKKVNDPTVFLLLVEWLVQNVFGVWILTRPLVQRKIGTFRDLYKKGVYVTDKNLRTSKRLHQRI